MLRNYFTIAFRNVIRHKSFAAINIAGLTLGISCSLVIFLIVRFELSFDTFHSNADRIYRVLSGRPNDITETGTPHGLMQVLKEEFSEVEKVAVIYRPNKTQIEVNDELTSEPETYFVTPSFFEIFTFEWITGSPQKSLSQPGQIVIDEAMAQKYFEGDAMGKSIRLDNEFDLVVSGIIKNMPQNTNFPIQMAVSHATFQNSDRFQNGYSGSYSSFYETYVLLREGANPSSLEAKFPPMVKKYLGEEMAKKYMTHALQRLQDIHFDETTGEGNFIYRAISRETIGSMILIGIFLLIIACINFVNLATAQAVKRSKEVGIRKVLGSTRKQLIAQFLGEAFILALMAIFVSFFLVYTVLPYLVNYLDISMDLSQLFQPEMLWFLLVICILTGLFSGFYPAFVLSRFKPAVTIKSTMNSQTTGGFMLRKGLVIFQFAISQILMICTVIVISQMQYFNTTSMGFNKEAVVTVDIPESNLQKLETMRNMLTQYASIKDISFSLNTPATSINKWWNGFTHRSAPEDWKMVENKFIDEHYLEMYDIPLLAGRNLSESDSSQILVNEAFTLEIGMNKPEEAIGETIHYWEREATIVGVVKDFHTMSLHEAIPPLIMWRNADIFQKASFKIEMSQVQDVIAKIEQHWKAVFPTSHFTYQFLDDDLATFYKKERKTSRVLSVFACIAIFIGCLGLYGLISFITVQKAKEIGIRKVMGATVQHIVYIFTKDFMLLISVAFLLAAPVGYYIMQQWLENFTYRIDIRWWMFAVAALTGMLIVGLTVSFKSIRAALANPVDSLRNE